MPYFPALSVVAIALTRSTAVAFLQRADARSDALPSLGRMRVMRSKKNRFTQKGEGEVG